ncbi:MAG: hypothetical protein COV34_02640 [Candidatus Zambryskibacteria bacterium CG10_big_fil_rev_8_21_14_0_10_42_12]|uniref:DUF2207 domain-containing protein n=1 Tax=Candidatus Zambryskibacteria bacterium CG10_big_fil_rev_8_21_14_0_10_42_12 TaxID=1975115 RepID=A0A2H0QUK3_9BACT|nr:MAG: hypothetical protein COV34_02640 [Candidatus Zambryskibacteria bacterium CG10_big_fil_rev_8_21_14_0_10_42_12]
MNILFKIIVFGWLGLLPFSVSAEVIGNFDVYIDLRDDGSFTVTEEILYDFESAQRHGIFRTIPTNHPQDASAWYKDRYIDIEVESVLMDGEQVPYNISTPGKNIEIKIGDPDKTITGPHTYTIVYEVEGALFKTNDIVELYWNATGNEWPVSIENARIEINAPQGVLGVDQVCYIGVERSNARCDSASFENIAIFIGQNMGSREGLTVAQSLSPNMPVVILEAFNFLWLIPLLFIIMFVALPVWTYRVLTKHKIHGPIIPEYEPYNRINPLYAGMLVDNTLHTHDITAAIVYLAEQGILKITKTEKKFLFFPIDDYEIETLKSRDEIVDQFLLKSFKLLFGERTNKGNTVTLSELKKNMSQRRLNSTILRDLTKELKDDMKKEGYFEDAGLLTRRTRKGYEAMNHLKGFKEFLSVTGKDRFKFHNAPQKNSEQFLEYLPYAIAFGVEKEWAKVFDDMIIPDPTWYEGGTAGAFSATAFSSDMSAFSSSLATSSGTSASGGGGSSGGGAGGGGGGSW